MTCGGSPPWPPSSPPACSIRALATPGLGWDETVYVSQVDPHTPAAFFSAPRARGVTFLLAPAAALTTSATVLHCYLAVLSGAGLLLSLCVWRRLLPAPVPALGGALFAGLWITLFYGPQAMPNLWVAYAALAATGCFLRAVRQPSRQLAPRAGRGAAAGLAAAVAVAALMRPTDAVWLAVPLFAAALCVPAWRRPAVLLALPAGLALGCAEWVAEAYLSYGGLLARLRQAGRIQGGLGWHLSFDDHARALQGKTLCRPCHLAWDHPVTAVWWFVLPLAVIGAVWAALRVREPRRRAARIRAGVAVRSAARPAPARAGPRPAAGLRGPPPRPTARVRPRRCTAAARRGPGCVCGTPPVRAPVRTGPARGGPGRRLPRRPLPPDRGLRRSALPAARLHPAADAGRLVPVLADPAAAARHGWAVAALVLVLLSHEAVQLMIVHKMVQSTARAQTGIGRIAGTLREAGVRPPCVDQRRGGGTGGVPGGLCVPSAVRP